MRCGSCRRSTSASCSPPSSSPRSPSGRRGRRSARRPRCTTSWPTRCCASRSTGSPARRRTCRTRGCGTAPSGRSGGRRSATWASRPSGWSGSSSAAGSRSSSLFALFWCAELAVVLGVVHRYEFRMGARFGLMFTAGALLLVLADKITVRPRYVALAALLLVPSAFLVDYRLVAAPLVAYCALALGSMMTAPRWRFTQDLSYGTYVYAFPLQQLLACVGLATLPMAVFAGLAIAVTLPVAAASWFLVERPALRLKRRPERRSCPPAPAEFARSTADRVNHPPGALFARSPMSDVGGSVLHLSRCATCAPAVPNGAGTWTANLGRSRVADRRLRAWCIRPVPRRAPQHPSARQGALRLPDRGGRRRRGARGDQGSTPGRPAARAHGDRQSHLLRRPGPRRGRCWTSSTPGGRSRSTSSSRATTGAAPRRGSTWSGGSPRSGSRSCTSRTRSTRRAPPCAARC